LRHFISGISLLFLLLLNTSNCLAQVEIGAYAGLSSLHLSGDRPALSVYKPGPGLSAGAIFNFNIREDIQISLQPGVSLMNAKIQTADTVEIYFIKKIEYRDSVSLRMGFARLPVLIKVLSDNRRFHFTSGIDFIYLFKSLADNGVDLVTISKDHRAFNVSAKIGMGINFPLGGTNLSLDLIYNQSLNNWSDNKLEDSFIPRIKSSGIDLNLAWTIPVSRKERTEQ